MEVTTDNKNRSASEVRQYLLERRWKPGQGALAFNFKRKGQILLSRDKMDEDSLTELALENDAEDIVTEKEHYEIICETSQYDRLAEAFDKAGIETDSSELAYLPNNLVPISDHDTAGRYSS